MKLPLILHPDSHSSLTGIEVDVSRSKPRRIALRFVATGPVQHIKLPRQTMEPPERIDGLWKHTCFEAFVRAGEEEAYHEFNLSPSRDWACYEFEGYRAAMHAEQQVGLPRIETWLHLARSAKDKARGLEKDIAGTVRRFDQPFFELSAMLEMERMLAKPIDRPWRLGLSAVIEERSGRLSYWALAHPPGAPDFHHRDCFALELAAARPA